MGSFRFLPMVVVVGNNRPHTKQIRFIVCVLSMYCFFLPLPDPPHLRVAATAVDPLAGRDVGREVPHTQTDCLEPAVLLYRRTRHHHERLFLGNNQHTRLA